MKTITVTYISPVVGSRQHCAELLLHNRDIELVAIPSGLIQQGVWQVLSVADVVVIDEAAIRREGFEAVNLLLVSYPDINCLIVMEEEHHDTMVWALTQGIRGILVQRDLETLLAKAIRHVKAGEIWISRRLAVPLRDALSRYPGPVASYPGDKPPARGWAKWH